MTTTADSDTDDETFTVALDTANLPTSVKPGNRTSVEITITEATLPSITLSATPETVEEGGAVTITATVSDAVAADTEVKLVRDGPTSTAGEPDFQFETPQMGVITTSQTTGSLRLSTIDDELVEGTESLTLNGLVGRRNIGAVTLTIEDNDAPEPEITYTLSGPEDPNLVEGKLYWITVTASAPVPETIEVEIKRDAAASTASDEDFRLGPIRITAGKTTGRTQLYVQVDSHADGGADGSTPEKLVLFGRIGAHQFGELEFTIWDHAVPALPIGGALLLGALLARRGAVRAHTAPWARQ